MKSDPTPTHSRDPSSKRLQQSARWAPLVGLVLIAALAAGIFAGGGEAATAPSLGTADSFAVLAGSTVTNTGSSTIVGDLGVSPGSAVTGFPPGVVTGGTIHVNDANAIQAQNDVTSAYNVLADLPCDSDLTDTDLGGLTLTQGVYCFDSSSQLTGTLTLDAEGQADAVFVFQIGSTLTTASSSSVSLINSADSCNVFWQVGSSATLGSGTSFSGSILALTSITLNTNASIAGRALARNGAVTLDSNTITASACAQAETETPTPTETAVAGDTETPTVTSTATETAVPGSDTPTTVPGTDTPTPANTPTQVANTATPISTATLVANMATPISTATEVANAATPSTTSVPQVDTSTLTSTTPTGNSASPPQAPIEYSTPLVPAAPSGGSFVPPSAGDGGLVQQTSTSSPATRTVLGGFFLLAVVGFVLLRSRRGVS